jgi:hypothetical protein
MLTAERIEEYTKRGYSPRKLIKSPKNTARDWQVKTAMSLINPKDYDRDLFLLPLAVWRLAEHLHDADEVRKHINQANSSVLAIKYKRKYEKYKTYLIVSIILGFYSTFFAVSAYLRLYEKGIAFFM